MAGTHGARIEIRRTPEMLGNIANSNVLYQWGGVISERRKDGRTDEGLGIPVGARGWAAAPPREVHLVRSDGLRPLTPILDQACG